MPQIDALRSTDAPRRMLTKVPEITLIFWFAVMMFAVFGTMAANGIHIGAGIPYTVTTPVFALVTGLIFLWWRRSEGTLSILFAGVFAIPAIGWWRLRWNPILSFWFAYIVTRPLGASFTDGFSKPRNGGLSLGDPVVSLVEFAV